MNFMSVDKAARASSCEGGDEGEGEENVLVLPMLGLMLDTMLGLSVDGGAIERGLVFVTGVGMIVLGRDWCIDEPMALSGDTSISSTGDSRLDETSDCGSCFEVVESGEDSAPTRGTV